MFLSTSSWYFEFGITDNVDIPFRLAARFGEKKVVRNYMVKGQWPAEEEREGGFPFEAGKNFKVFTLEQRYTIVQTVQSPEVITLEQIYIFPIHTKVDVTKVDRMTYYFRSRAIEPTILQSSTLGLCLVS